MNPYRDDRYEWVFVEEDVYRISAIDAVMRVDQPDDAQYPYVLILRDGSAWDISQTSGLVLMAAIKEHHERTND